MALRHDIHDQNGHDGEQQPREQRTPFGFVLHFDLHGGESDRQRVLRWIDDENRADDILVPYLQHIDDADADDARSRQRKHDAEERSEIAGSVDGACLLQLLGESPEEADQDEDAEGERIGRIHENQPETVVGEAEVVHEEEQRNQSKRERNHHGRNIDGIQHFASEELVAGQRVRRHSRKNEPEHGRARRDGDGIDEVFAEVVVGPYIFEVRPQQRELRQRPRHVEIELLVVLERVGQRPEQRIDDRYSPQDEESIEDRFEHRMNGSLQHVVPLPPYDLMLADFHLFLAQKPLQEKGRDERCDEDDRADRGSVSEMGLLEGLLVQVGAHDLGRVVGTAGRHDRHDDEGAVERRHHDVDDRDFHLLPDEGSVICRN